MNILAHTPFIGNTGYANHARSFFCALNKFHTVKVRCSTVGDTWTEYSKTPHDNEPYITEEMKEMLIQQTLTTPWGKEDFNIYGYNGGYKPDVHIVLAEVHNHYFYDEYDGYKIAYNVWESTRYPEDFFERLKYFDEVWVPSQWQYDSLVEQGYPQNKISIVPEGVDIKTFKPLKEQEIRNEFKFLLFGRWEHRKSTTEIIKTFGETFRDNDDVVLLCSVENPFPFDGLKTTEERIEINNINYPNVRFIKFPPREDYVRYLQEGDVFVSCARSEGWNLPLIEAMACGTPSIYSNWGGQLQFAYGKGIPVKVKGLIDAELRGVKGGKYSQPDYEDLGLKMLDVYQNYMNYKINALNEASDIHIKFNWNAIANHANEILIKKINPFLYFTTNKNSDPEELHFNFIDGPFVEIIDKDIKEYKVKFIDLNNGDTIYETNLESNCWCKPNIKYRKDWLIKIEGIDNDYKFDHEFNPSGRRVLIGLESKSLGDTIAWVPQVERFRRESNSKVICSTFHNKLFQDQYPNIEFVQPGSTVNDVYTLFRIGVFKKDGQFDADKHPIDPKTQPLGKICSDILGIDYIEEIPKLPKFGINKKKQVSIATHATAQCKYWNNPTGWQDVVDHLVSNGYEVKLLSREESGYMGNEDPKNVTKVRAGSLENVIKEIQESELFIGISSGLSWLAWGAGTETIIISGFTDDYLEPTKGIRRIINKKVCHGCWSRHEFDPGDWYWCPEHKDTGRQFECSKQITSESVIEQINLALGI